MMEITIDEAALVQAINDQAAGALTKALGGYQVRDATAKIIAEEFATKVMAAAVQKAADSIDIDALAGALAKELARAAVAGAVGIFRETVVNAVAELRGVSKYSDGAAGNLAKLRLELFGVTKKSDAGESITGHNLPF